MKYDEYIKWMISEGWEFNRKTLTEKDSNVKTFSRDNVRYDSVIIIQCPSENIMLLCGTDLDETKAHTIRLKLANKEGIEIPSDTNIRIVKESSDDIVHIELLKYSDVKTPHKLKYGIELGRYGNEFIDYIYIYATTSSKDVPIFDIDKDETELNLEIDVWSKTKQES